MPSSIPVGRSPARPTAHLPRPWRLAAALTLAGILAAPSAARAAEGGDGKAREYKPLVVSFDLSGALTTRRYGVQLEWAFAEKDSLVAYPWHMENETRGVPSFLAWDDSTSYATQSRASGIDAEYRHYFGGRGGAEGFFVAPGFEAQHFVTSTQATVVVDNAVGPPVREEWSYVGPSFDLGGQLVVPFGFVLGGSVGVHYRVVVGAFDDAHYAWEWGAANGPGLRPRMRFWLGWAF